MDTDQPNMDDEIPAKGSAAELSTSMVEGRSRNIPTFVSIISSDWDSHDLVKAIEIVHAALPSVIHRALPLYALDIGLKWSRFATDIVGKDLRALPLGILRVLLWDIWKDFCMFRDPHPPLNIDYTAEDYHAQIDRLQQLEREAPSTEKVEVDSTTEAMNGRNFDGAITDLGSDSTAQTVNFGLRTAVLDGRHAVSTESSGGEMDEPSEMPIRSQGRDVDLSMLLDAEEDVTTRNVD